MGSIKRHRKVESDCDTYQYVSYPGGHDFLSFGEKPFSNGKMFMPWLKNSAQTLVSSPDFKEDEYPYQYSDAWSFRGPVKI